MSAPAADMLAYVISSPGSAGLQRVPVPAYGDGDVLVRVEYTALNRKDLFLSAGLTGPGIRPVNYPLVPGGEVVGTVAACPDGSWPVGHRVLIEPTICCGTCGYCRSGATSHCAQYGNYGEQHWGGLAEYAVASANTVRSAQGISDPTIAAASPVAFTTAWNALITTARLQPGNTVLITGIGGGVATAGLQIARLAGARVLVTSRQQSKVTRALELGADDGVVFDPLTLAGWVQDRTGGRGADIALDSVGASTWRPVIRALAPGGRLCAYGATSGDTPELSIREIYQAHRQLLGTPMGGAADFDAVWALVTSGRLTPVIDSITPLTDIDAALRRLQGNEQFGKILIDCR